MPSRSNLGKRILSSKILLLISLLILIFFSTNLVKEIINRRDLKKEISSLAEEINRLEGRNQELSSMIEYFKSIDFVEKEARTKLNLRKPGEKIIIVAEEETPTSTVEPVSESSPRLITAPVKTLSNPERWWNYFFKNSLNDS